MIRTTNPPLSAQGSAHYHATSAYSNVQSGSMSGFEVVAELYKGMIRFVGQAKSAYEAGNLEDMCFYIQKTNKILIALQSNLNFEEGGEASVFLNDFYTDVFTKLFKILRSENPVAEFDAVHKMLVPVRDIWISHAENAKSGAPKAHIDLPSSAQSTK